MPLGILNNIPSLSAENELTLTSNALNSTLEQLASGSRINSGADDPAGLAIANGLQANVAALTQSVSNANDGVGELQLADGALSQVTTLLDTAVTLATESATGTVSNSQRTAIQAQYASILAEINQIGTATTYNGQSVFQGGTEPNLNAATSPNVAATDPITLNDLLTTGSTTSVTAGGATFTYTAAPTGGSTVNANDQIDATDTFTPSSVLTNGGTFILTRATGVTTLTIADTATVAGLISTINTGTAAAGITITSSTDADFTAGETSGDTGYQASLNAAGNLQVNDANGNGDLAITGTDVGAGDFAAGFASAPASSTVQDLINAINGSSLGVQASLANGALSVTDPQNRADLAVTTDDTVLGAPVEGAPTTFTTPNTVGAATPDLNELVGSTAGLTNATAIADGTTTLTAGGKTFTYTASGGTGTVGALINAINNPSTDALGLQAYLNSTGNLVISDPNNNNDLAAGPTVAAAVGTLSNPTTTTSATTNIFLSDSTSIGSAQIAVNLGALSTTGITNGSGGSAVNLATTDLSTQTDAQNALTLINQAISNVASVRGTLGASVNRLTAASNVINSQVQNLTSAENTITAADIPTVVANLTKYSILEQTGISALAQANQQQQLVLKLLQ
ncbi:MAG TPA: flagellin [Candidatus Aquilonibacter sp.]|nr:flagellin [Candidatus Aquilonibacter sp.]